MDVAAKRSTFCTSFLVSFEGCSKTLAVLSALAMAEDDPKACLVEAESMKRLAFFGVAVSTVATLVAIVCVPMLCTYMQNVQSNLQDEITFCRTRAVSLRGEYAKVEVVIIEVLL
uniref:Nematode cuticle collagen N-terminal domain-containing protein n=1 Tax=Parascaris univalens TaxID=6257 RepID=A0A915BVH9_PARUN